MMSDTTKPALHADSPVNETHELFRLLVEAVSDYAIFALDLNGNILTWNTGARRLKGYEPYEVIGTHFSRFYTPKDIERNHPSFELKEAIKNGSYEEEGWRIKKDGTLFWANVLITALKDKDGNFKGFAKVTRDLTSRKIAEDELRAAYDSLEERVLQRTNELEAAKALAEQAVSARDEFLSIASHELKTPLTSLRLQIQMRKRSIEKGNLSQFSPDKLMKVIQDDEKQINRISRLVDDMLDITHLTSGKFSLEKSDTDLSMMILEVLERFAPQLEMQNIPVTLNVVKNSIGQWDFYRVEQVFINLLTNAMKYGSGNKIEVSLEQTNASAVIKVRDHGLGISIENHQRVFQQFERAVPASSISGLGLGLYIARQIMLAHGGDIVLESEIGKGSTFSMILPLS